MNRVCSVWTAVDNKAEDFQLRSEFPFKFSANYRQASEMHISNPNKCFFYDNEMACDTTQNKHIFSDGPVNRVGNSGGNSSNSLDAVYFNTVQEATNLCQILPTEKKITGSSVGISIKH